MVRVKARRSKRCNHLPRRLVPSSRHVGSKCARHADASPQPARGDVETPVVPSGPDLPANADRASAAPCNLLRKTTQRTADRDAYFVPVRPLMLALVARPTRRGVKVSADLPRHVDSKLIRLRFPTPLRRRLCEAGVRIALFNRPVSCTLEPSPSTALTVCSAP